MSELDFEDFDNYLLSQNGKIIHQVWFGTIPNKKAAKKEYKKLKKYRDSWKIKNPQWFHIEWDKKMCKQLVKNCFPQHLEMYESYPYEIQRCDAVRYCFLSRYGGLYADMDYYCNKPFNLVLQNYPSDFYLVQTPNMPGEYVSNSLMYTRPKHPFWESLLIEMHIHSSSPIYYSRHLSIMFTAGPGIVNRVFQKYKNRYHLRSYPHKFFQPYGQADDILSLNNPNVYTVHASKGCWHSNDSTVLVILCRDWPIFCFIVGILISVNILFKLIGSG
jgi:mannosyltransferase OCH1-like enzyme